MCWTGDSVILGVIGYVVCFFGVDMQTIPATYFLLYSDLPTYSATSLNCTWLEAKACFCFNETV